MGLHKEKKAKTDRTLLGLILLLVAINMPAFLNVVLPLHDTLTDFQIFYFFYNEFFFSNEVPGWLPFGFYGVQSDFFLISFISPSGYLAALLGWLFKIENVLFLFTLSLFLEQLILLFGTYLLARNLFKHNTTVIFVCVTALCSTVIMYQNELDFRIYAYLPLVIHFIITFFSNRKPHHLLVAMNIFVISFLGLVPYKIPVPALALSIIFTTLLIANLKDRGRFLSLSRRDLLPCGALFVAFIVLIGAYYWFISHAMDFTESFHFGRDPATLKTDLDTFLSYSGDMIGFSKFSALLYPAPRFIISDLSLHVGLITLPFMVYGLAFARTRVSIGFAGVVIVFGLLSLGEATPVAELLYDWFPMMDYYRHIGHVVSSFKLFLPLLAGFGVERFIDSLSTAEKTEGGRDPGRINTRVITTEALLAGIVILGTTMYSKIIIPGIQYLTAAATALVLLVVFALRRYYTPRAHFSIFLVVCVLIQMLGYRALVDGTFYVMADLIELRPVSSSSITVNDYPFQETRSDDPPPGRPEDAMRFVQISDVVYTFAYNFLQWDPCVSPKRTDFLNSFVASLIRLDGGVDLSLVRFPELAEGVYRLVPPPPNDNERGFLHLLGCLSPKLGLFTNPVFADSSDEARKILEEARDYEGLLVLENVGKEDRPGRTGTDPGGGGGGGSGEVRVLDFNANRLVLEVRVLPGPGAWLYYADAWHPGWRAFVDGRPVPIRKANLAFKAVHIEEGRHTVRFEFVNRASRITGRILIVSGLIFMFILIGGVLKRLVNLKG